MRLDPAKHERRIIYGAKHAAEPLQRVPAPDEPAVVVTGIDGGSLAKPLHLVCVWTDQGTKGDKDCSFWRVVAPENYRALSDIAINMSNKGIKPGVTKSPDEIDPDFRCVHQSLVEETELGPELWTDRGSRGKFNGRVHAIRASKGIRVSENNGDRYLPCVTQYKLKALGPRLYRDMEPVMTVGLEGGTTPAKGTLRLMVGYESKTGESREEMNKTIESITQKVTAGINDVSSSETSISFGHEWMTSQAFTTEMTVATRQETEISVDTMPGEKAVIYQLVVTDSSSGCSGAKFILRSATYQIKKTPLGGA